LRKFFKNHNDFLLVLCLAATALALQFIFLNPPVLSDQLNYFFLASRFPDLPNPPDHQSMRIGLIIPLAGLIRIFGYTETAYYALPFISAATFTIAVYALARKYFSRFTAFLSALLPLFMPYMLSYAGFIIPDIFATGLFTFSAVFLIGLRSNKDQRKSARRIVAVFGAGVLMGCAYLMREYLMAFILVLLFIFWAYRLPFKELITFGLGLVLVAGFEFLFNYQAYGNALIRFMAASPRLTEGNFSTDLVRIATYFAAMLMNHSGHGYLLLPVFSATGAFFYFKRGESKKLIFILWLAVVYLFLTCVGALPVIFSWTDRVLLRINKFRYWIPLLPPLTIGGVAGMGELLGALPARFVPGNTAKRLIITAIIVLMVIPGVFGVYGYKTFLHSGNTHYLEFRDFMRSEGGVWEAVWVNRDSFRALERVIPLYLHDLFGRPVWEGKICYLNTGGEYIAPEKLHSGLLIVDTMYMDPNLFHVPRYLADPPAEWELVFQSENGVLRAYDVKD